VGFVLEAKGTIVLRPDRLDVTLHDITDNSAVENNTAVKNVALFIFGFLSIPPWFCLYKIPLSFIFIKKELQRCKIVKQIIPTLLSLYKCLK
jgi:hypothetical protein